VPRSPARPGPEPDRRHPRHRHPRRGRPGGAARRRPGAGIGQGHDPRHPQAALAVEQRLAPVPPPQAGDGGNGRLPRPDPDHGDRPAGLLAGRQRPVRLRHRPELELDPPVWHRLGRAGHPGPDPVGRAGLARGRDLRRRLRDRPRNPDRRGGGVLRRRRRQHPDAADRYVSQPAQLAGAAAGQLLVQTEFRELLRGPLRLAQLRHLHVDRAGDLRPRLDADRPPGSGQLLGDQGEGVHRSGALDWRHPFLADLQAHPAQRDEPDHRRRHPRRRRRDHLRVDPLLPRPRLPLGCPDLGHDALQRQGLHHLHPARGAGARHDDFPHRPRHQLRRRRPAGRARPAQDAL
ncbi:MAG: Oligopeptide transport system permease protein OppC, partial [uncultured Thermomicrobiales bacterium]